MVHFQLASDGLGNIQTVRASRVEVDLLQDQMSAFTPTRKSVFLDAGSGTAIWKEQAVTRKPGCSIKLPPCPGRESHRGVVIDPAQSELADAPV